MPNEKIEITDILHNDIIEQRKKKGLSAYELSEKSGHSKYWLPNIESRKTQKVNKSDLIAIYKILLDTDDVEEILYYIGQLLELHLDSFPKEWYEYIDVSDKFEDIYDESDLDFLFEDIWSKDISKRIWDFFNQLSIHKKQVALTVLDNFYNCLFKEPEFSFLLLNIPIYGIKSINLEERNSLIKDLLSLYKKYNNLVVKNNSMNDIKLQHEYEDYYEKRDTEVIHKALDNFKEMIQKILDASKTENPDMYALTQEFRTNVALVIEDGQPNATKNYLHSTYRIGSGKNFATHIQECVHWFIGFQERYNLPYLYDVVDDKTLEQVYSYLNSVGEIHHHVMKRNL